MKSSAGWVVFAIVLCLAPASAFAQRNVSLELVTEPGFPITGQQKWITALKDLDVGNLRIREGRPGDRAEVIETGSQRSPSFTVVGILTARNKLVVPGGSFGMDQRGELKAYLAKVASGKADEPVEEVAAFGLSPEQLVATHEALAGKIRFSTKDKTVGEVTRALVKEIDITIKIDTDAREAIDAGEGVLDELSGLSVGTALAATLRPAGCVFAPVKYGKDVRLRIADSRSLEEAWPIGWPAEKGLSETLPKLGNFLNVDIADVPLQKVIDSIQSRAGAPFLYDYNGMARQRIDPAKIKVSHPSGKTYYKKVLDATLGKAHLQCEVRLDEADTPFVWISPVK